MLSIDGERHEVKIGSREVHLSPKEFDILLALKQADGRTLSRERIIETVWGIDYVGAMSQIIVDQHVARLRRKLGKPARNCVFTVPCRGYRFKA